MRKVDRQELSTYERTAVGTAAKTKVDLLKLWLNERRAVAVRGIDLRKLNMTSNERKAGVAAVVTAAVAAIVGIAAGRKVDWQNRLSNLRRAVDIAAKRKCSSLERGAE